jgi:hypothetical protein
MLCLKYEQPGNELGSFGIHLAAIVLTVCNGARVLVPQIVRLVLDPDGSKGVSCLTWRDFAAANLCTVVYALVVVADWNMAAVLGVNLVFCLAISLLACWKRYSRRILNRMRP